jgi:hypothetical protein
MQVGERLGPLARLPLSILAREVLPGTKGCMSVGSRALRALIVIAMIRFECHPKDESAASSEAHSQRRARAAERASWYHVSTPCVLRRICSVGTPSSRISVGITSAMCGPSAAVLVTPPGRIRRGSASSYRRPRRARLSRGAAVPPILRGRTFSTAVSSVKGGSGGR